MQKVHDPSNNRKWVNYPDISSPIIDEELNRHETELDEIDSRVVIHETTKANQVDLLTCVASITLNTTTGILTITLKNGSSTTIDTGLSKLAVNFDYDADPESEHYQQLILEMADGTYKYIDLSALITQFEFVNSATITWTVGNDGKVTANIINGSITEEMLETNFLANCRLEVSKALGFSQDAEAWAKGTKGGTPVASTDEHYHNNSKYYAEQSQASSEDSEAWAKGTRNGVDVPSTDETYENNAKYYAEQARSIVGDKVDSFNGRTGVVVPENGDYSIDQIAPASGAQVGQVPVIRNVGTGQEVELGFVLEAFSKSTVGLGNVDNTADNNKPVPIVECSTARSTANKVVALTGFTLKTGSRVYVRFTNTGTANPASGNLTLNVNSTGAKTIVDGKTNKSVLTYSSAGWFYNNIVSEFVYDGTYWVWMSRDNNTTYSAMSVSELTTGTATSLRTVRADYLKTGIETLVSGKTNKTDIATVESGTTASRAYSTGELLYYNGTLYRVKTAIASGATFTVGTNVEVTNVSEEVYKKSEIKTKIISSVTTSADGFVNTNLPNRAVLCAFCNGYICAIYRDGNGNNFVKVLDYNLVKVANTNVSNIVTLYL